MDAKWLNAWSSFVAGEVDDPPGPVSSAELFVPILESTNNEASHDSEKGEESKGEEKETKKYKPFVRVTPAVPYSKLLPGLRPKIDYRAVPPVVFYLFVELHGKDNSPELCRYVIDIYKYAIPVEDLINIQYTAMVSCYSFLGTQHPRSIDNIYCLQ